MTCSLHILLLTFTVLFLPIGCTRQQGESEESHAEHRDEGPPSTIVHLDRHKVYHAGIKVERVASKSIALPLTLTGRVSFDERRLTQITARVSGRIENVNAFVNDQVRGDDVLLELFSQEYLAMQNEFLQAAARWKRLPETTGEEKATARAIYESARRKLNVMGSSGQDVEELERTATAQTHFHVRAPFSGTVIESSVRQGSFVQVGTELYGLADLSTLWVLADLYEKDLPHVRKGMKASVEVSAFRESWTGLVSSVYSVVDERTRTVKARVEVQNANGKLKPGMFCTVKIQTRLGNETIKIPASALLGETEKHFVFVSVNDTTFEKRDVRTGTETRDYAEILDGIVEGEKIVVRGGFFLKSELAKETFGEEHGH